MSIYNQNPEEVLTTASCIENTEQLLMHTYARYQIVLDHGEGVYLYDRDGNQYLDFFAGIAVFALGYQNERLTTAMKEQIDKLLHTSNYFYSEPLYHAAAKFVKASGMDRVFFTNSGTEAIEGAIKLARKYYYLKHGSADSEIIAMEHSFHGRTMGSVAVTGNKKYREPFEPLIGGVQFASFNDFDSVKRAVNEKTAAILLETVQGEGGIYPADKAFLEQVRALCTEKDILLILDEIQCGMGRTGTMFAYEQYGLLPDIMTSAKALGCGVPIGAFAATEHVANAFVPGDHGTTYGGNPFVTNTASAVFDAFEELRVLDNVKETGAYLYEKLEELKQTYPQITAHRGMGLMQGLEFSVPVKEIIQKAMQNHLLLIGAGANVIRFLPPLVIQKSDIDEMLSILKKCL